MIIHLKVKKLIFERYEIGLFNMPEEATLVMVSSKSLFYLAVTIGKYHMLAV